MGSEDRTKYCMEVSDYCLILLADLFVQKARNVANELPR